MKIEDICFAKAHEMILTNQAYAGTDVFELTEVLINIVKEKKEKEKISDSLLDYNDPIVSIEEVGQMETMDIGVTGDNLFYCNDILTKNSLGIAMTADLMLALISTEELEELGQIMVKQLKNRYGDPAKYKRFVVGVDRSKMRLYNVEQSAQDDVLDSPTFDKSRFSEEESERKKPKKKFDKSKFSGFK